MSSTKRRPTLLARSYLYVPGDRPELAAKATASGADAIVVDLEDAVGAKSKARARASLDQFAAAVAGAAVRPLFGVRLSCAASADTQDIDAAVAAGVDFLRLAKAQDSEDVLRLGEWLELNSRGSVALQPLIESAEGVRNASDIASAPLVAGLALGATDLAADLSLPSDADDSSLVVAASLLVIASAAAGAEPPVASVHRALSDLENLRSSTDRARRLGFFGRSAVHPRQIAVINDVFTPIDEDAAWASGVVHAGVNGAVAVGGELVDPAVGRRARHVLGLVERFGTRPKPAGSR